MNSRRAEKTTAAERAENMIEKIKYWLFQKGKDCKRCCLRCRYYDICRWDVLGNAGLQSEETITLLAIENSKPHKDGLLFRICQYVEFKQRARNFRLDDESGHQEALFSWAAYRTEIMPELQYMYHVPNGGKRDKATAAVLKRQGVKAGVPDIMLPAARAGYHGLYIELKAGENTTTKKQKEWLEYLRQQGYYTAVCYGWQPAAQLIEQYLLHSDELTKEQETVTMR